MSLLFPRFKRILLLGAVITASFQTGCVSETEIKSNSAEKNRPKNVIIFIGDGMGVSTITAARIFDGQSKGMLGEEHSLSFEDFEDVALIKTYNTNSQVPDSAGTATAILSGYKTNIGTVNVTPNENPDVMVMESCVNKTAPATLTDNAKAKGKAVGVISTARITHATPAAMYGHAVDRGWEADKDITERVAQAGCTSLAQQLVDSDVDLALGGGLKEFTSAQIEAWPGVFVENSIEMTAAPADQRLLGLFNPTHMSFEADRNETDEPSLADMTSIAIERLSKDEDGYVLMVEAGRVDHAHHGTNAFRAMRDMQALNDAVQTAKDKAGDDTLIMVTADHSHVFVIQGYPERGNPILGLVNNRGRDLPEDAPKHAEAEDGKPYTTVGYYNGPNNRTADSPALTNNDVQSPNFRQQTAVPLESETHAGEDVPLYATGPGSENVKGVMEQDEIGRLITEMLESE